MKTCLNCGNQVKNKYCGVSCQNKHQKRKPSAGSIEKRRLTLLSLYKEFVVQCKKCGKNITINEYKTDVPKKEKYFCSRKCANSRKKAEVTKLKQSVSAKNSDRVLQANRNRDWSKITSKRWGHKNGGPARIERIQTPCGHCQQPIEHKINESRKYHKICWLKISGGIRKGSSRSKHGWYKGFWCDSSYELGFVIYCLEHNLKIERNKKGYKYIFENTERRFFPDFIVDGEYVEIKNFRSMMTDAKIKQFPGPISIVYKDEMKSKYLPYVIDKYGIDFIKLYEDVKYGKYCSPTRSAMR